MAGSSFTAGHFCRLARLEVLLTRSFNGRKSTQILVEERELCESYPLTDPSSWVVAAAFSEKMV